MFFSFIMARFENSGNSSLDKEINIRIRPRSVLKGSITILVLFLVFFLGRWSVDPTALNSTLEPAAVVEVAEVEVPEAVVEEDNSNSESGITGWFAKLFSGSNQDDEVTNAAVVETGNVTNTTDNEIEAVNTTPETPGVAEEPIITTYTKVALAINDVDIDWKETWGKITKVDYTIRNNEVGTIKADHVGMLVEGYDDFEKKIPIPLSSKTMKAGEIASSKVLVPQGFSYSEVTAGDLTTVEITFTLYDVDNKVITSFKTAYNLKG